MKFGNSVKIGKGVKFGKNVKFGNSALRHKCIGIGMEAFHFFNRKKKTIIK